MSRGATLKSAAASRSGWFLPPGCRSATGKQAVESLNLSNHHDQETAWKRRGDAAATTRVEAAREDDTEAGEGPLLSDGCHAG